MIKQQSGVALLVVLIMLLVVAMLGVSAMRGSLFHERMAYNSQAEDLTFQAAETSINSMITQARIAEINGNAAALLSRMLAGQTIDSCVTLKGGFKDQPCSDAVSDTFDTRSALLSSSVTRFDLEANAVGFSPDVLVDLQFETEGDGRYLSALDLPFENQNIQQWRKLGPPSGYFSDFNDKMQDDIVP